MDGEIYSEANISTIIDYMQTDLKKKDSITSLLWRVSGK